MKNLEEIRQRCVITEDGHWLWRGALRPMVGRTYTPRITRSLAARCGRSAACGRFGIAFTVRPFRQATALWACEERPAATRTAFDAG